MMRRGRRHRLDEAASGMIREDLVDERLFEKLELMRKAIGSRKNEQGTLRAVFNSFDLDQNGTIDEHELREAFRKVGILNISKSDTAFFLSMMDRNCDNVIDYHEFVLFFEQDIDQFEYNQRFRAQFRIETQRGHDDMKKEVRGGVKMRPSAPLQSGYTKYASGQNMVSARRTSFVYGFNKRDDVKDAELDSRAQKNQSQLRKTLLERITSAGGLPAFFKKLDPEDEHTVYGDEGPELPLKAFKRGLDRLGLSFLHQSAKKVLESLDADGNGSISLKEAQMFLDKDDSMIAVPMTANHGRIGHGSHLLMPTRASIRKTFGRKRTQHDLPPSDLIKLHRTAPTPVRLMPESRVYKSGVPWQQNAGLHEIRLNAWPASSPRLSPTHASPASSAKSVHLEKMDHKSVSPRLPRSPRSPRSPKSQLERGADGSTTRKGPPQRRARPRSNHNNNKSSKAGAASPTKAGLLGFANIGSLSSISRGERPLSRAPPSLSPARKKRMPRYLVDKQILQILRGKVKLDRQEEREGRPRVRLTNFVQYHMQTKFGQNTALANEKLASFLSCLQLASKSAKPESRWQRMFACMIGIGTERNQLAFMSQSHAHALEEDISRATDNVMSLLTALCTAKQFGQVPKSKHTASLGSVQWMFVAEPAVTALLQKAVTSGAINKRELERRQKHLQSLVQGNWADSAIDIVELLLTVWEWDSECLDRQEGETKPHSATA